jgi:hypothetical protein
VKSIELENIVLLVLRRSTVGTMRFLETMRIYTKMPIFAISPSVTGGTDDVWPKTIITWIEGVSIELHYESIGKDLWRSQFFGVWDKLMCGSSLRQRKVQQVRCIMFPMSHSGLPVKCAIGLSTWRFLVLVLLHTRTMLALPLTLSWNKLNVLWCLCSWCAPLGLCEGWRETEGDHSEKRRQGPY